ncbi:hypothetical protein HK405_013073 [Cladochytrium tenue]|nr:hypothetical protein HK405_013073 [Cladochytrium tenue]
MMSNQAEQPQPADCLACRLTGSGVALGVSAYCAYEMRRLPLPPRGGPTSTGAAAAAATAAARDVARHRGLLGVMSAAVTDVTAKIRQPDTATATVAGAGAIAKAPLDAAAEFDAKIEAMRTSIQALERAYRDNHQSFRQHHQPYSVFSAADAGGGVAMHFVSPPAASGPTTASGLYGDPALDGLVSAARTEMAREKAAAAKAAEVKIKERRLAEEALQEKIQQTKRRYKEKQEYIRCGPIMLHNFTSLFGDVVHVEDVTPADGQPLLLAAFLAKGRIELWRCAISDEGDEPESSVAVTLVEIFDTPLENIASVVQLQPDPPAGRQPQSSSSSVASLTPALTAADRAVSNFRGSTVLRAASKSRPALRRATSEFKSSAIDPRGRAAAADAGHAPVRARSEKLGGDEDNSAADATGRFRFFVGGSSGEAAVVELQVAPNGEIQPSATLVSRRLSLSPIRLAVPVVSPAHAKDSGAGVALAAVVSPNGVDQLVVGLTRDLDIVWHSGYIGTRDDDNKTWNATAEGWDGYVHASEDSYRKRPDELMTALAFDAVHRRILVAAMPGTVLSLSVESTTIASRSGAAEGPLPNIGAHEAPVPKEPSMPGSAAEAAAGGTKDDRADIESHTTAIPDQHVRRELLISWCFDVLSLEALNGSAPPVPGSSEQSTKPGTGARMASAGHVSSMNTTRINGPRDTPHCLVGCVDGTLRTFPLAPHQLRGGAAAQGPPDASSAAATPRSIFVPEEFRLNSADADLFSGTALALSVPPHVLVHHAPIQAEAATLAAISGNDDSCDGVGIVLGYSDEGVLTVFDSAEANHELLQLRILSDRLSVNRGQAVGDLSSRAAKPATDNTSAANAATPPQSQQQQAGPGSAAATPAQIKRRSRALIFLRRHGMCLDQGQLRSGRAEADLEDVSSGGGAFESQPPPWQQQQQPGRQQAAQPQSLMFVAVAGADWTLCTAEPLLRSLLQRRQQQQLQAKNDPAAAESVANEPREGASGKEVAF